MVYIYPKDKITSNILDRLINDKVVKTSSINANSFSKYKPIRYLRKKDKIFIAKDHRKDISLIYLEDCKPRRKGNKYFFDL